MNARHTARHHGRGSNWPAALLVILQAWLPGASAHRLDECLQAARVAVAPDRVEVELDLTPGADTAAAILPLLDLDHDGRISLLEEEGYADLVRRALTLEVDGRGQPLAVLDHEFPSPEEMKAGAGVIRLKLSAEFKPLSVGPHQLHFGNRHETNVSVYLVNALLPETKAVVVTRQQRDPLQREYQLDFSITALATNSPAVRSPSEKPPAKVRIQERTQRTLRSLRWPTRQGNSSSIFSFTLGRLAMKTVPR